MQTGQVSLARFRVLRVVHTGPGARYEQSQSHCGREHEGRVEVERRYRTQSGDDRPGRDRAHRHREALHGAGESGDTFHMCAGGLGHEGGQGDLRCLRRAGAQTDERHEHQQNGERQQFCAVHQRYTQQGHGGQGVRPYADDTLTDAVHDRSTE